MSTSTLPNLPSDVLLIIFEYTVRHRLDKESVYAMYYYSYDGKTIPNICPTSTYDHWLTRLKMIAGVTEQECKPRVDIINGMKKLRLLCKRFSQILPRPPPNYWQITKEAYHCVNLSNWVTGEKHKYISSAIITILGILYAFLRVKFDTIGGNIMSSMVNTRHGTFRIKVYYDCATIHLPNIVFNCDYEGLSLTNKHDGKQVTYITYNYIIEACRQLSATQ
jgi:hypothetical protein